MKQYIPLTIKHSRKNGVVTMRLSDGGVRTVCTVKFDKAQIRHVASSMRNENLRPLVIPLVCLGVYLYGEIDQVFSIGEPNGITLNLGVRHNGRHRGLIVPEWVIHEGYLIYNRESLNHSHITLAQLTDSVEAAYRKVCLKTIVTLVDGKDS